MEGSGTSCEGEGLKPLAVFFSTRGDSPQTPRTIP